MFQSSRTFYYIWFGFVIFYFCWKVFSILTWNTTHRMSFYIKFYKYLNYDMKAKEYNQRSRAWIHEIIAVKSANFPLYHFTNIYLFFCFLVTLFSISIPTLQIHQKQNPYNPIICLVAWENKTHYTHKSLLQFLLLITTPFLPSCTKRSALEKKNR